MDQAGTADANDVNAVVNELSRLPREVLDRMRTQGIRVKVVRNSVVDYDPSLRGVQPRGWPAGSTWDSVPGMASGNDVVIATRGHGTAAGAHVPATGDGHGSHNLVIHETFHALDHSGGNPSAGQTFNNARTGDAGALDPYQNQAGGAGQEETYAESAAQYYGGDPNYAATHPNLHGYWNSNPFRGP